MMTKKIITKCLVSTSIIATIVLWSEYHSSLNKFLNIPDHEFELLVLSILIIAIATVSIITTMVALPFAKDNAKKRKIIILLNLLLFASEVFPTIGLFVINIELYIRFLYYIITGFGSVLVLVIIVPNIIAVVSLKKRGEPGNAHTRSSS